MFVDFREAMKKELFRRKYSSRTIETYLYCVDRFFSTIKKTIEKISKSDIREYLNNLAENKAGNTVNVNLNSLKFLFEDVLGKKMKLNIKYSKVPEKLPLALDREECKKLFDAISNPKHKLMVQLLYGAGLRASELLNLKIENLNLNEKYGFVRHGKGNKDRIFIIPESLKQEIIKLIDNEKLYSENYLFASNRNSNYNIRSLQEIIKKASKKAGLNYKKISPHTLRHSFATHLIESGNSISEIQALLGHKSPETTFTYLHSSGKMVNIKSPLDFL